jgi:hypothetical protein
MLQRQFITTGAGFPPKGKHRITSTLSETDSENRYIKQTPQCEHDIPLNNTFMRISILLVSERWDLRKLHPCSSRIEFGHPM